MILEKEESEKLKKLSYPTLLHVTSALARAATLAAATPGCENKSTKKIAFVQESKFEKKETDVAGIHERRSNFLACGEGFVQRNTRYAL